MKILRFSGRTHASLKTFVDGKEKWAAAIKS